MDIINDTIQRHPVYRGKDVRIRHKMASDKERPQTGATLQGASASRIKMSPDDYLTDLCSHTILATDGKSEGVSIEWSWEDTANITRKVQNEDVTGSLDVSRRVVTVGNTPIVSGFGNTKKATNFAQVVVRVDGSKVLAAGLEANTGRIILQDEVPPSSQVTVSYFYKDMDLPGYYYIEMVEKDQFNITPMHTVKDEVVIVKTTGSETSANLDNGDVLDSVFILYTKKTVYSEKLYLVPGEDFTVDASGEITFLTPLKEDTTLFCTYRYQGADRGPFTITNEYEGVSDAIKGAILAFGSRPTKGDKQIVILTDERETVASVYGGHYEMSFDISVYARDPQSAQELADHIVSDVWANKKEGLKFEGLVIEEFEPSGESEESYDDTTGTIYFQQSLSLSMMTEWKSFKPHMVHLEDFNIALHRLPDLVSSKLVNNKLVDTKVAIDGEGFDIIYPKTGYPVYF
jgi:hypothetical protein